MNYRTVTIGSNGIPDFGTWTTNATHAFTEAGAANREAGFPCSWVEDEENNRVTMGDIRIRMDDQLTAEDIYGAASRISSHATAAKVLAAIAQAERGE